jgi:hypothetical protein
MSTGIGRCGICHRTLTNPVHIEAGIGPVCASRIGHSFGKTLPARAEPRATYSMQFVAKDEVLLRDSGQGRSITNDAERVVADVLARAPGHRIFYIDTMGACDELVHDGQQFTGFAPARGRHR